MCDPLTLSAWMCVCVYTHLPQEEACEQCVTSERAVCYCMCMCVSIQQEQLCETSSLSLGVCSCIYRAREKRVRA